MDDQFNRVLRLETTTNDVSFFKHDHKGEHRDHHETHEIAPLRKTSYRLIDLREILLGCNRRYLEYLSALDDFSAGDRHLHRLTVRSSPRGLRPGTSRSGTASCVRRPRRGAAHQSAGGVNGYALSHGLAVGMSNDFFTTAGLIAGTRQPGVCRPSPCLPPSWSGATQKAR